MVEDSIVVWLDHAATGVDRRQLCRYYEDGYTVELHVFHDELGKRYLAVDVYDDDGGEGTAVVKWTRKL